MFPLGSPRDFTKIKMKKIQKSSKKISGGGWGRVNRFNKQTGKDGGSSLYFFCLKLKEEPGIKKNNNQLLTPVTAIKQKFLKKKK